MPLKRVFSFALCLLISSVLGAGQVQTLDEQATSWLNDHTDEAFDRLLPLERGGYYVAYRLHRDLYYEVPEEYFAIERMQSESGASFKATIVKPIGASIQEQLREMHLADRQASLETLIYRVKLQRHEITSEECNALRSRFDALTKLTISTQSAHSITLHPFVHRVVLSLGSGNIDASLHEDDAPLVKWARTTLDTLSRCVTTPRSGQPARQEWDRR